MKKPALNSIREDFDARIMSAVELFAKVADDAKGNWNNINGWEGHYPGHARRIVGLAFMQMLIAWEELVEATLMRYIAGASAPSGYSPNLLLGHAKSISHAYQLISGKPKYDASKHFMSWDTWSTLLDTVGLYIKDAAPFSNLSALQKQRLHDAKVIRNRVAHFSKKVREDFVVVAKSHIGLSPDKKLSKGYDVGQLLIDESSKGFGSVKKEPYFIHYANLILACADVICPPNEEPIEPPQPTTISSVNSRG
ncbi:hypothetical protein [Actomonas aquatica]|uniref:RiboL-PSP-HEPN domain-containing protein n=1 Tax=Actomonas aquatica TaxID=2866162 RepID=A0ABZ1C3F6_9BACT|nr:hypothetical protein [Opitutus sp. WL0086]WRQ85748.1 hypothetical protein K1X11_013130 [Opitutus sp. WL0086]